LNRIDSDLAAEHVVPLQELVQEDTVEEPAQADAQKDAGELEGKNQFL
jgi:hypothetical protein